MRRAAVILLLSFYSLGTLVCPLGDFVYLQSLPQMYAQCSDEDPDMNVIDFVFEHLLNLENILEHSDNDRDDNEKPHQPFHQLQVIQQVLVINNAVKPQYELQTITMEQKPTYPLYNAASLPSNYLSEIFHPPAA